MSRALGYVDNGFDRHRRDDYADDMVHLRLTRDAWRVRGPYAVRVECLEPCLTSSASARRAESSAAGEVDRRNSGPEPKLGATLML